eukprot:TRINITY_DN2619_c0_g1_i2.p1 TRINITY_DN2619_c0_g1~~TRINITY_DN2619_c0_g1_i2.p1  ORF type:complete len:140 (-),score=51.91 TRINITY_DN2619_c0_g1_i2:80-499(-)
MKEMKARQKAGLKYVKPVPKFLQKFYNKPVQQEEDDRPSDNEDDPLPQLEYDASIGEDEKEEFEKNFGVKRKIGIDYQPDTEDIKEETKEDQEEDKEKGEAKHVFRKQPKKEPSEPIAEKKSSTTLTNKKLLSFDDDNE